MFRGRLTQRGLVAGKGFVFDRRTSFHVQLVQLGVIQSDYMLSMFFFQSETSKSSQKN